MPVDLTALPATLPTSVAALLGALVLALIALHLRRGARLRAQAEEVHHLGVALARSEAATDRLPALEAELETTRRARDAEHHARTGLQARLQTVEAQHEVRLEELDRARADLEHRFAAMASQAMAQNSEALLHQVSERFALHAAQSQEDLTRRQQAIEHMVKPLGEKLGVFDSRIGEIEKARNEAYGQIRAQVQALAQGHGELKDETRRLVQALRAPKTRGRWGEMQLRQVFELAGMSEHVDFSLEHHIAGEDGARRPDAVVHIPGGRSIVVDAKTPLEAYLDALDASSPDAQATHLTRHAAHVRAHVKGLASKGYQSLLPGTPDFLVMFIPGETFVSAAAEADPGLIDYAFDNKVLIATPTTLIALVKAIAYGWQQDRMAQGAVEVQQLARELYDRLGVFAGHLDRVGQSLNRATDSYNKAVGSLEMRVLTSARKFGDLGVVPDGDALPRPAPADNSARPVTAPEAQVATQGSLPDPREASDITRA